LQLVGSTVLAVSSRVMMRQLADLDPETQDLVERLVEFVATRREVDDKHDVEGA